MLNRYCKDIHPAIAPLSNNATNVWKRMWHIRDNVEPYLHWIIGRGDIDISLDKWMDINLPLLNERVLVKTLSINEKEINIEYVTSLLGTMSCDLIKQEKVSLSIDEDKLCWSKTSSGNFTIKSAWKVIRQIGLHNFTYKYVWHPHRPLKISVFVWKLLHNAIPIDTLTRKKVFL